MKGKWNPAPRLTKLTAADDNVQAGLLKRATAMDYRQVAKVDFYWANWSVLSDLRFFLYIQSKTILLHSKKKIENQGKAELIILFCHQRIIRLQQKLRCQFLCYWSIFLSYLWIYHHIHRTQNHYRLLLQLVHLPVMTLVAWGISFGNANLTLQMSRQPTWHAPATAAEQLSQSDPSLIHWI